MSLDLPSKKKTDMAYSSAQCTEESHQPIRFLSFHEAAASISAVNATLGNILHDLNPAKDCQLVQIEYSYGDLILDDGVLQVPIDNKLVSIHDPSVPENIKKALTYSAIPLFLTLENDCEVFIQSKERVIPLNIFSPGNLLGLFELVDYLFNKQVVPKWSVSAGARSIVMLPKISDTGRLAKLSEYFNFSLLGQSNNLDTHWELLKLIANHTMSGKWKCRVLFFNDSWFSDNAKIQSYVFKEYLIGCAWKQAQFSLRNIENVYSWEILAELMARKRLKPDPYLVDQIKHIINIMLKKAPGFTLATTEAAAPISEIQQVFVDIYGMKNHVPSIMQLASLDSLQSSMFPIYYSFACSTVIEGSPLTCRSTTRRSNLRDTKRIFDLLFIALKEGQREFKDDLCTVDLTYFHTDADPYHNICTSTDIPKYDRRFAHEMKSFGTQQFCSTSSFWRGCIGFKQNNDV